MKNFLANFFLKLTGWRVTARVTPAMAHSVMVAAPHTSNWDFPFSLMAFWKMGVPLRYFIKNEYTRGPLGWFFRWTGAIGVDRSKKKNKLTDKAIELLNDAPKMVLMVPAEGTRKRTEKWRTGFYRIALETGLPISLGFLDYHKKEAGVLDVFYPSGDFEKDMLHIQELYKTVQGKHPEDYNPQIF
ncbi:MAG: 1-acyl-sn-glycerol-3-phosphate acyltransferase [Owenweeksia sp.]|nr:1-acyl-sn-glycerol-3-phosphate acyltransferase [Owenweeksia sp.]